ncbi:ABC transporter permease [Streptomyces amakusaensis]|uniref:FtsX-like permease family protein n=1 Tax=Streptomyces amakusaensis TaxID=67271 RepID=A0ABW0AA50_9ACTN
MTLLNEADAITPPVREELGPIRSRLRDIGLGIRFGAFGGREGWIRNALTATGVGLGVALLLMAASLPQIMSAREDRMHARTQNWETPTERIERSDSTVVWLNVSTEYRDSVIGGRLLRADGDRPALPPGVDRMPGPGEMLVSPALADLLASPDGSSLAGGRLDYRVIGVIGEAGLIDPGERFFYAGSSTLTAESGGQRSDGYGRSRMAMGPVDPMLTALATLISVVLLAPVAVFIGTSVRFCGDRRDSRLAALRLIGADSRTIRRIAVGESLFGSALGLAVGVATFATARLFAGSVRIWGLSAFPSDVVPVPALGGLILLAVPVVSVVVTLITLRSVLIEPLGVVRRSAPRRRRLWWRLVLPSAGVLVLLTAERTVTPGYTTGIVHPLPLAGGAILVLLGVTALFPWVVDAVVSRLRGGPVSWQLAVRGLQLRGGSAGRAVSGILVAVAGAIALQMVFAGMHDASRRSAGGPMWSRVDISAGYPSSELAARMNHELSRTPGVSKAIGFIRSWVRPSTRPADQAPDSPPEHWPAASLVVADCPVLRKLAGIGSCADGDTFIVNNSWSQSETDWLERAARDGERLTLSGGRPETGAGAGAEPDVWRLPSGTRTVKAPPGDGVSWEYEGIYATPGALDPARLTEGATTALVTSDENVPHAHDHIRDTASRLDPLLQVWTVRMPERDQKYASIHNGLLAGATGTMALIAVSMLVSQIEQLRERRRLLPVLVAFGTRRSTLARSLLWQTALPVALGTVVAVAGGLVLGVVMLRLTGKPMVDWWMFLPVSATAVGVILLVTVLSLPALWRMMRPDGLRTE